MPVQSSLERWVRKARPIGAHFQAQVLLLGWQAKKISSPPFFVWGGGVLSYPSAPNPFKRVCTSYCPLCLLACREATKVLHSYLFGAVFWTLSQVRFIVFTSSSTVLGSSLFSLTIWCPVQGYFWDTIRFSSHYMPNPVPPQWCYPCSLACRVSV